jgi:cytidylate kinase
MLITISRQYGAGGSVVARLVADALGWRVVDNELIDLVAARAGLPSEEVAQREERAPGFVERLARSLASSAPELFAAPSEAVTEIEEVNLVRITESVVAEIAATGRLVMVGRAASAVLGSPRDALNVRVVAPKASRLQAAVERLNLSPKDAERELASSDENRRRYHLQYYRRDWNDPLNYHMVLNTEALGLDGAAQVVVGRAKSIWPDVTRERRRHEEL